MITKDTIKDTVYELYKQAVIVLGDDVKKSLEDALKVEEHDLARLNIEAILKNIELAEEKGIPMCQDTGLPVVFVKLGNVEVEDLRAGIEEGIEKATHEIPIRPNIVDPLEITFPQLILNLLMKITWKLPFYQKDLDLKTIMP